MGTYQAINGHPRVDKRPLQPEENTGNLSETSLGNQAAVGVFAYAWIVSASSPGVGEPVPRKQPLRNILGDQGAVEICVCACSRGGDRSAASGGRRLGRHSRRGRRRRIQRRAPGRRWRRGRAGSGAGRRGRWRRRRSRRSAAGSRWWPRARCAAGAPRRSRRSRCAAARWSPSGGARSARTTAASSSRRRSSP